MRDSFGVSTSGESMYVEQMEYFLANMTGYVKYMVPIPLDSYTLRFVPLLSSVASVGLDVFPYRSGCQILTQLRRLITQEDYLITRQSRSDWFFGQYADPCALTTCVIDFYINTYP